MMGNSSWNWERIPHCCEVFGLPTLTCMLLATVLTLSFATWEAFLAASRAPEMLDHFDQFTEGVGRLPFRIASSRDCP